MLLRRVPSPRGFEVSSRGAWKPLEHGFSWSIRQIPSGWRQVGGKEGKERGRRGKAKNKMWGQRDRGRGSQGRKEERRGGEKGKREKREGERREGKEQREASMEMKKKEERGNNMGLMERGKKSGKSIIKKRMKTRGKEKANDLRRREREGEAGGLKVLSIKKTYL